MAAAVTLTSVAQLENRASHFAGPGIFREKGGRGATGTRATEPRYIRVLSAIPIYFASNLHVSPRVSSLFRAQHSCGTGPLPSSPVLSRSLLLFCSLSLSLLFFLYIVTRTVGEPTRNPLVASTHHPQTTTVQGSSTPPRSLCSSVCRSWIGSLTENYGPFVEAFHPSPFT